MHPLEWGCRYYSLFIKVRINNKGGSGLFYYSNFITLSTDISLKQVTVQQHIKEIYSLELIEQLLKNAP